LFQWSSGNKFTLTLFMGRSCAQSSVSVSRRAFAYHALDAYRQQQGGSE